MPTKDELKDRAFAEIDSRAEELIGLSQQILANPEPGFREFRTAALVGEQFAAMGVPFRSGLGMTGLRGEIIGGSEGPSMAIMGELDSLIVNEHPHANAETGAAHACGHHCQIAMMLGVTKALMRDDVLPHLSGRILSMAVPAEEYIEIEYRDQLRRDGKIEFLGGKPEFIRLGEFDDVHLAMMMHTTSTPSEKQLCLTGTNNGTVAKKIQFVGKGAHAGGSPHLGINALNAATLAMSAIHFNRETFLDTDTVRVHPIITKGGEAVSAVPADVRMETFVRGKTLDAIKDANRKVDRALRSGAMAMGATVNIQTIPGYLPMLQDDRMQAIFRTNAEKLVGAENIGRTEHRTGSTDMGDVSALMPVLHPYVGGATGIGHGADYVVQDYQMAVITGAKAMASTVIDLMADGAKEANQVVANHRADMTSREYVNFMRSLAAEESYTEG